MGEILRKVADLVRPSRPYSMEERAAAFHEVSLGLTQMETNIRMALFDLLTPEKSERKIGVEDIRIFTPGPDGEIRSQTANLREWSIHTNRRLTTTVAYGSLQGTDENVLFYGVRRITSKDLGRALDQFGHSTRVLLQSVLEKYPGSEIGSQEGFTARILSGRANRELKIIAGDSRHKEEKIIEFELVEAFDTTHPALIPTLEAYSFIKDVQNRD